MSEQAVRAVLLGHAGMPDGMVDAVRHITGCSEDALSPLSNSGMSPDALAAEVVRRIGDAPAILFTDLQSGSCGFAARRIRESSPRLVVISGVNLPLLIDYVMNRSQPLDQLVPRLLSKGRAGMCCAPAHLEDHERTALPR